MEAISDQAARWAVRADAGPLSPNEEHELNTWLEADPRHRGAYVRARAQWVDLDRLAALHGPATANPSASAESKSAASTPIDGDAALQRPSGTPITSVVPAPLVSPTLSGPVASFRMVSRRQMLAASAAVVTVLGGGLAWRFWRAAGDHYTSGIGEVRRIALADGSTMLLNTDTEVAVHLTAQQRDIHLIRGEALFEVAHDKARPFIVQANGTAVRAVGTAFAVRLEAAQVDVTVTEGVVEVAEAATLGLGASAPTATRRMAQRVAANERLVIARATAHPPQVRSIAPVEADRQLAWREGMVSFDGESLQTAVAEINRHNRRQIVIDDPLLADKPVVGIFRATDLDGFSAAAAEALQARAVFDDDVIRLESAAPDPRN